jgi:hypothetical protein
MVSSILIRQKNWKTAPNCLEVANEVLNRAAHHGRMETRGATRFNVLGAGTIEFDGGEVNCVVRDMSIAGAALEVLSSGSIPEHFTLTLPADSQRIPCHIVWRKEQRIGVAFDWVA